VSTLAELVNDRSTRIRGLEVTICAHVLLNRNALDGLEPIALSPETAALLSLIIEESSARRIVHLPADVGPDDERRYPGILALAMEVQRVAGELAAVGSLPLVVDNLRDAWLTKALRERKAA
jgi:hypothetical protein